ncbi:MAG: hypothetical protein V7K38_11280 [Nostoc sp.]|uniref:hypothetical protein n=1 Tax=Nostoc sp. TaxID=1180 RepID=UPI002FF7CB78
MAKKHKRFGALHKTLKDTNYSATSGAAGEYLKYLQGTNKLVVARKLDSKYLVRFNVGVIPFDIEPSSTSGAINAYQGTITVVANNILTKFAATATDALLGIERDLTKTKEQAGFYPALAHIAVIPSTTTDKTAKTSGITKRAYKAYPTRTGGVPYGRTTTTVKDPSGAAITDVTKETEEDSRGYIMTALKGITANNFKCIGVSFTPELHPEAGFFGVAKPTGTGVPTDIPAN